jgi:hypothetical protein
VLPGIRRQLLWHLCKILYVQAHVRLDHQLNLFSRQLALAAELGRPVSLHCVRAHGHLQDLFERLPPDKCPPRIMVRHTATLCILECACVRMLFGCSSMTARQVRMLPLWLRRNTSTANHLGFHERLCMSWCMHCADLLARDVHAEGGSSRCAAAHAGTC